MKFITALLSCLLAFPAVAQTVGEQSPDFAEPVVQRTSIEDEGSRINELRVRGHTQRITVQPKVGSLRAYEIITGDSSSGGSDPRSLASGAAGKRVWQVLAF